MAESDPNNPYAPPKAALKDPSETEGQPRVVRIAVTLLWIELGLSVVSALTDLLITDVPASGDLVFSIAWSGAWIALAAFLNLKIAAGYRWARTLTLVLAVLGTLGMLGSIVTQGMPVADLAFGIVGTALDAAALVLLYRSSARGWFGRLD
jgi:hypothetical protein